MRRPTRSPTRLNRPGCVRLTSRRSRSGSPPHIRVRWSMSVPSLTVRRRQGLAGVARGSALSRESGRTRQVALSVPEHTTALGLAPFLDMRHRGRSCGGRTGRAHARSPTRTRKGARRAPAPATTPATLRTLRRPVLVSTILRGTRRCAQPLTHLLSTRVPQLEPRTTIAGGTPSSLVRARDRRQFVVNNSYNQYGRSVRRATSSFGTGSRSDITMTHGDTRCMIQCPIVQTPSTNRYAAVPRLDRITLSSPRSPAGHIEPLARVKSPFLHSAQSLRLTLSDIAAHSPRRSPRPDLTARLSPHRPATAV